MIKIFLLLQIIFVGLDQGIKYIIEQWLPFQNNPVKTIPYVLQLQYVENRGAAFGILQGNVFFLAAVTGVILLGVCYYIIKNPKIEKKLFYSLSLVVGGGLGNLIDRIFRGFVVDYLELSFMQFPVFNLADCFVVLGTVGLVISIILLEEKEKK